MAGFVRIRQVESRTHLGFGRTLRLSSDRHDLIPPPLCATLREINILILFCELLKKVKNNLDYNVI